MKLDFENSKIDEAIRKNSKRSSMILDLSNNISWTNEEKIFLGRESKNKIELTRIKNPLTGILPNLIIVFKKDNIQNPKLRLSILAFLLYTILLVFFSLLIFKKLTDSNFQVDLMFVAFLIVFLASLLIIEYFFTIRSIKKFKKRIL